MMTPASSSSAGAMRRRKVSVKSLNREFQIFRNNALQKRRFRNQKLNGGGDDLGEDRVGLLADEEEAHFDRTSSSAGSAAPPPFVRRAELLSHDLDRLSDAADELEAALRRGANRPAALFEDDDDDLGGAAGGRRDAASAAAASELTAELERGVRSAHRALREVKEAASARRLKHLEAQLADNLVRSLTERLKAVMEKFGMAQNSHLKQVKARESNTQKYFQDFVEIDEPAELFPSAADAGRLNTQELIQLEENSRALARRERDIDQVVRSISELNAIFRDLGRMVTEQGEVVDRIECNVDTAGVRVEDGLQQLKKAERYQRKNWKMKCILLLAAVVVLLLLVLIVKI